MPAASPAVSGLFVSGIAKSMAREWVERRPFCDDIVASKLSDTTCTNPFDVFPMPLMFESFTAATAAEDLKRRTSLYEQVTRKL